MNDPGWHDASKDFGRTGEIITATSPTLRGPWPTQDPRARELVPTRRIGLADAAMLASTSRPRGLAERAQVIAETKLPSADKVLAVLNDRAVQFNSRPKFSSSAQHRATIEGACGRGEPVRLVLPMFCVINNPAKRFGASTVTAAETVTLMTLAAICDAVSAVYAPGLHVELVGDSVFYATPFGVNAVEAQAYLEAVAGLIRACGVSARIRLHDMAQILSRQALTFGKQYRHWVTSYTRNALCDGISITQHARWVDSMRACVDVGRLGMDYEWLKRHFAGVPNDGMPDEIYETARLALIEYRALKAAAADVRWEDHSFPGAIRATVHTKEFAALGVRVYPEYKRSCRLLPYHGVPVIRRAAGRAEPSMTIAPEMLCYGADGLTRVIDEEGNTSFYED